MSFQIASLPAVPASQDWSTSIGQILQAISQGITQAPEVRQQQETNQQNLAAQRLDMITRLAPFLPPNTLRQLIGPMISTAVPGLSGAVSQILTGQGGSAPSPTTMGAAAPTQAPAGAAPGAQGQPSISAPDYTGLPRIAPTFDQWARQQGLDTQAIAPYLITSPGGLKDQYDDYVQQIADRDALAKQAEADINRIESSVTAIGNEKNPLAISAALPQLLDQVKLHNSRYGILGPDYQIDPNTIQQKFAGAFAGAKAPTINKELDRLQSIIYGPSTSPDAAITAAMEYNKRYYDAVSNGIPVDGTPLDLSAVAKFEHTGYERMRIAASQLVINQARLNEQVANDAARLRIAQQRADQAGVAQSTRVVTATLQASRANLTSLRTEADSLQTRLASLKIAYARLPVTIPGRAPGSHVPNKQLAGEQKVIHDQIVEVQTQLQRVQWEIVQSTRIVNDASRAITGAPAAPSFNEIPPDLQKIKGRDNQEVQAPLPDGRRFRWSGGQWHVLQQDPDSGQWVPIQ